MPVNDSGAVNQQLDCKARFAALVRDLDAVLAVNAKSVTSIYNLFKIYFPIERCNIEDVLKIARASGFFVSSEEQVAYYNIAFKSGSVSSGFLVQISLNKKTGNLELPFAKVNGY